jgi:hypothetical protein
VLHLPKKVPECLLILLGQACVVIWENVFNSDAMTDARCRRTRMTGRLQYFCLKLGLEFHIEIVVSPGVVVLALLHILLLHGFCPLPVVCHLLVLAIVVLVVSFVHILNHHARTLGTTTYRKWVGAPRATCLSFVQRRSHTPVICAPRAKASRSWTSIFILHVIRCACCWTGKFVGVHGCMHCRFRRTCCWPGS